MNISVKEYESAKTQIEKANKKLATHQATVKAWDDALKGYKAPEGQRVVEVQINGGAPRYVLERVLFKEPADEPAKK